MFICLYISACIAKDFLFCFLHCVYCKTAAVRKLLHNVCGDDDDNVDDDDDDDDDVDEMMMTMTCELLLVVLTHTVYYAILGDCD